MRCCAVLLPLVPSSLFPFQSPPFRHPNFDNCVVAGPVSRAGLGISGVTPLLLDSVLVHSGTSPSPSVCVSWGMLSPGTKFVGETS